MAERVKCSQPPDRDEVMSRDPSRQLDAAVSLRDVRRGPHFFHLPKPRVYRVSIPPFIRKIVKKSACSLRRGYRRRFARPMCHGDKQDYKEATNQAVELTGLKPEPGAHSTLPARKH